ncbi:hypothetical protein HDU96_010459 [Phlyctochytrium bullatum]|nr:hypothetical protein HDU96_010459 [Phlyctochytrium bullatum]
MSNHELNQIERKDLIMLLDYLSFISLEMRAQLAETNSVLNGIISWLGAYVRSGISDADDLISIFGLLIDASDFLDDGYPLEEALESAKITFSFDERPIPRALALKFLVFADSEPTHTFVSYRQIFFSRDLLFPNQIKDNLNIMWVAYVAWEYIEKAAKGLESAKAIDEDSEAESQLKETLQALVTTALKAVAPSSEIGTLPILAIILRVSSVLTGLHQGSLAAADSEALDFTAARASVVKSWESAAFAVEELSSGVPDLYHSYKFDEGTNSGDEQAGPAGGWETNFFRPVSSCHGQSLYPELLSFLSRMEEVRASKIPAIERLKELYDMSCEEEIETSPSSIRLLTQIARGLAGEETLRSMEDSQEMSSLFTSFLRVIAEYLSTGRIFLAHIASLCVSTKFPVDFRKAWWEETADVVMKAAILPNDLAFDYKFLLDPPETSVEMIEKYERAIYATSAEIPHNVFGAVAFHHAFVHGSKPPESWAMEKPLCPCEICEDNSQMAEKTPPNEAIPPSEPGNNEHQHEGKQQEPQESAEEKSKIDIDEVIAEKEKLRQALQEAEKDKAALEKQKAALEKDLKRVNDLFAKTKDKATIVQLSEENSKLKAEVDMLMDQRSQNISLKENMHHLAQQFDEQRLQLARLTQKLSDQTESAGEVDVPKLTATLIDSFEKTISELREENSALTKNLKSVEAELATHKEKKTAEPQPTQQAQPASKIWWATKSSAPTTASTKPEEKPQSKPEEVQPVQATGGAAQSAQPSGTGTGWWWAKTSAAATADANKKPGAGSSSTQTLPENKSSAAATSSVAALSEADGVEKQRDSHHGSGTSVPQDRMETVLQSISQIMAEENAERVKDFVDKVQSKIATGTAISTEISNKLEAATSKITDLESAVAAGHAELVKLREELSTKTREFEEINGLFQQKTNDLEISKSECTKITYELQLLTSRIKDLETENGELRLNSLQKEIQGQVGDGLTAEEAERRKQELEEKIAGQLRTFEEKIAAQKRIMDETIERERASFEAKSKEERSNHQKELAQVEEKLQKSSSELAKLREEYAVLENKLDAQQKEVQRLQEAQSSNEQETKRAEAEIAKLKGEKDQLQVKISADATALEKLKEEVATLTQAASKNKLDLDAALKKEKETEDRLQKEKTSTEEKWRKEKAELEERYKKERLENEEKFKKERSEVEEKQRKEKQDIESKHKKEKSEIEERLKRDSGKVQQDFDKLKGDYDKLKKDSAAAETTKNENLKKLEKELNDKKEENKTLTQKIKTLESDISSQKAELAKAVETAKGVTEERQKHAKEVEKLQQAEKTLQGEIDGLNEKCASLQSRIDVLVAEHEVLQSSTERLSKSNLEKDEQIKKLKAKADEVTNQEQSTKKQLSKVEREKEDLAAQLRTLAKGLDDFKAQNASLETEKSKLIQDMEQARSDGERHRQEAENAQRRISDLEHEMKLVEKRGQQLVGEVKDLQKQLLKEKKRENGETHNIESEASEASSKLKAKSNLLHHESSAGEKHKVEMITGDLLKLAQENEQLNKRARHAEEELKALNEKTSKIQEELESKSKVLQQYVLRQYSNQLQPDDKQRPSFNTNILSNANAMQKMDPLILSQVNTKMQKLLEDLASKIVNLEEENKALRLKV